MTLATDPARRVTRIELDEPQSDEPQSDEPQSDEPQSDELQSRTPVSRKPDSRIHMADDGVAVTLPSACPLDCPDHCSLDVTVENGRVVKLDGSHRSRVTDGYICNKVRHFDDRLYGEARLVTPGVRVGAKGEGRFEPVSWDHALDLIAGKLRETAASEGGAHTILPFSYGGSNGMMTEGAADARLFRRLGAARLLKTVCAAPTGAVATAMYGKMPGVAYDDYPHARMIVVWGANPSDSHIHLVPRILEAKKRGARLVVVDPRRTPLARQADVHLAVRPGTDLGVALAMIHWLFANERADLEFLDRHTHGWRELRSRAAEWSLERAGEVAGVDPAMIASVARDYADASPAVIRSGWGQERNRNGGSATAAILALPSVAGKFGVRGGGYTMSNSGAWSIDKDALVGAAHGADVPSVNMNRLGRHLLGEERPAVHALFVYNANPVSTLPEQNKVERGLAREDLFTVVFEQVMTDTARYADVLLPATTFLEHREVQIGYGSLSLMDAPPVISPVGEARSNHDVFTELASRLGLLEDDDVTDAEAYADALLDAASAARDGGRNGDHGSLRAAVRDGGVARPTIGTAAPDALPVMFVDHFPRTPDAKVHLLPDALDAQAPNGLYAYIEEPASADFPLALISPATRKTISSTLGELDRKPAHASLHPRDAGPRSIESGDDVRIWNGSGEVHCQARVSDEVRPGVVFLPKGIWAHSTANGKTSNALVPDTLTDIGGGACFNDARVEVEKRA